MLGNYRDGAEELERAGVVNGEGGGAAIDDGDVFGVGGEAGLDGFGAGVGAAVDGAGGGVNGNELVVGGGGGVDAIAFRGEIEGERSGAYWDAGDLVGA